MSSAAAAADVKSPATGAGNKAASAGGGGGGGGGDAAAKKKSMANAKVFDDPSLFDSSEDVKAVGSFESMGLKEDLLRGIFAYGFEKPSAIQQRAITPILLRRDVIAQSQSGTGKTTIFCVGILQVINSKVRETQALVLSPTRELAEQSRNVRTLHFTPCPSARRPRSDPGCGLRSPLHR
jgi:hypothetical protein